jgi:glycosyltransferase, group 2 family
MKKLTIILPVYNGSASIERCLKSVFKQNYPNLEIIIVNDGSTDNSEEIISNIIEKAKREDTIYIHKENSGVADTRNYAISIATGEYITFIDQDDIYAENYCSDYMKLVDGSTDIIVGGYVRVDSNENEIYREHLTNETWSKYSVTAPWSHVYKKQFLLDNRIEFLESAIGEDVYFNILAYAYAENVKICEDEMYFWTNNPESVSNSKQAKISEDVNPLFLLNSIYKRLPELSGEKREYTEYYFIRYVVWYILFTLKQSDWKDIKEKKKELFCWLEKAYPKYENNKNIKLKYPKTDTFRNRVSVWLIMKAKKLYLDDFILKILKRLL